MGLTSFQQATNHLLLHNFHQILSNVWKPVRYSDIFTKQNNLFRRIKFKPYSQVFFKSIRTCSTLEKVKIQKYCKPCTKNLYDCIFLDYNSYCCTVYFFAPTQVFRPFADFISWNSFYSLYTFEIFFTKTKISTFLIALTSVDSRTTTFSFTKTRTTLLTILHVLSADWLSK